MVKEMPNIQLGPSALALATLVTVVAIILLAIVAVAGWVFGGWKSRVGTAVLSAIEGGICGMTIFLLLDAFERLKFDPVPQYPLYLGLAALAGGVPAGLLAWLLYRKGPSRPTQKIR
jgi:hypothetical protein